MPRFERTMIQSGLPIYVAPRADVPLVDLQLQFDAGGEHNPEALPGLAAMTAAMLDEGTLRRTGPEIAAEVEKRGGALSCHADWNAARVRLQLLEEDLSFGLDLLAELATQPSFPQHELDRLRQQTLAELRRRSDQPAALADEAFAHHLFAGTVFRHPSAGTPKSLAALERDHLVQFHRDRYASRRASLVVAGAVSTADLQQEVDARLAGTPDLITSASGDLAEPRVRPDLACDAARLRVVVVDRPGAAQTELRIGHLGVPRTHPDRVALGVLNTLLGGKFTSRINLNLRERHGFTYGASSRFVDRKGRGPFVVSTAVTTSAAGRATEEVLAELRRIRAEPVAAAELEATKSYLLGVFAYGLQTIEGLAARLDEIALFGLPLDTPAQYLAEVAALDASALARLATEHLHPDAAWIVAVGPAAELLPQLRALSEPELWAPPRST